MKQLLPGFSSLPQLCMGILWDGMLLLGLQRGLLLLSRLLLVLLLTDLLLLLLLLHPSGCRVPSLECLQGSRCGKCRGSGAAWG